MSPCSRPCSLAEEELLARKGSAQKRGADALDDSDYGDLAFEDDDSCEEFIPKGALKGAAAAASQPPPLRPQQELKQLPGQLRALLPQESLSAASEVSATHLLTATQEKAVQMVAREAAPKSKAKEAALQARLKKWGYEKKLAEVLRYVRDEAPIIIHIDLTTRIDKLKADAKYRNLFETRLTSGCSDLAKRRSWEERLFKGIYKDSQPAERVKYGVLNAVNDPMGISSVAKQYGLDYLVLRGVRLRATFSDRDSCNDGQLASCEWYAHVLELYNDLELLAVTEVALGHRLYADSSVLETAAGGYKEVQIHGDIQFAEHIDAVVLHPSRRGNAKEKDIEAWCEQLGIRLEYMPEVASCMEGKKASTAVRTLSPDTAVWRWGSGPGLKLRFDAFTAGLLEENWTRWKRDASSPPHPLRLRPIGEILSVDFQAMNLIARVAGEEARLAIERCGPANPSDSGRAASSTCRRASLGERAVWEWCAAACGRAGWMPFDDERTAFLEQSKQCGHTWISMKIGSASYKVDFVAMSQVNVATNFSRSIRRSVLPPGP